MDRDVTDLHPYLAYWCMGLTERGMLHLGL